MVDSGFGKRIRAAVIIFASVIII